MIIDPIEAVSLSKVTGPKEIIAGPAKTDNVFDDVLNNAINALNNVSNTEFTANRLTDEYIAGRADLSDVMIATAKMSVAVQLAVTAITSAVNSFKEVTQLAI